MTSAAGESDRAADRDSASGPHAECYACPVGSLFASMREREPETLDHLATAAQELLAVARRAIDLAETALERRRGDGSEAPRVRRIDLS